MHVDATTLSDLEVFRDSSGMAGVIGIVDDTQTEEGRRALRRRLEHPHSDPEAIRDAQRAVDFFVRNPDALQLPTDSLKSLRRYVDSNIAGVSRRSAVGAASALWFATRYGDLYHVLEEGVELTDVLLGRLMNVARELAHLNPPEEVRALADDLFFTCVRCKPRAPVRSRLSVLRRDHFLRGSARPDLLHLIECFGELEALRSMGRAVRKLGWTFPEIVDSEQFVLEAEGAFHPFLGDPVPNPVNVTGGEPVVFLTGPNMAGKTTYLKSAALVMLLAHVGMAVPAARARFTPVDVLFTSLNPSDNLRAGLSYFFSEVLRVKDAAIQLAEGKRCFVLFDEVFKGTNVKDALDASATVIRGFAKARGSGFIFSSHLVELVDVLGEDRRVRFFYFDGRLIGGRAEYSYRMREGVSDQRLGLHLLNEARIPDLLARIGT